MKRNGKVWLSVASLAVMLGVLAAARTTVAQGPSLFSIDVRRMTQPDSSVYYALKIDPVLFGQVRLPNGVVVDSPPQFPFVDFEFGSFEELRSAVLGTWTIEFPPTPPFNLPYQAHTFEWSDFNESIFPSTPLISSPQHGSTVPPEFTMTWDWPSGMSPATGYSTLIYYGPTPSWSARNTGHGSSTVQSEVISAVHSQGVAEELILRVGGYDPAVLSSYLSPVVPQQNPSRNSFVLSSRVQSFSAPVHVNVSSIPEGEAIFLTAIGAIGIVMSGAGLRQRRFGSP